VNVVVELQVSYSAGELANDYTTDGLSSILLVS
jgi:hypothetical protein